MALLLDPLELGLIATAILVVALLMGLKVVGFGLVEVGLVLIGAPLLAFLNIPLFPVDGTWVGVNAGGALLPIVLSIRFLTKERFKAWQLGVATVLTTGAAYVSSGFVEGEGIQVYLWPTVLVAVVTAFLLTQERRSTGPLTYASGTLGVLIGTDLLHIRTLLANVEGGVAVIGGAGSADAVYLVGIMAVLVQMMVVLLDVLFSGGDR